MYPAPPVNKTFITNPSRVCLLKGKYNNKPANPSVSRVRECAHPTRPFVGNYGGGGVAGDYRLCCRRIVFPGGDPGSPLLCKKGRLDKKVAVWQNRTTGLVAFWGKEAISTAKKSAPPLEDLSLIIFIAFFKSIEI